MQIFSRNDEHLLAEAYDEILNPDKITVIYKASDGYEERKTYSGSDAQDKAKAFIDHWVGLDGEIGHHSNYVVSSDGVGVVAVHGIQVSDLLGREQQHAEPEQGYSASISETAMKMTSPLLLRECLKHKYTRPNEGSYIYDFKIIDPNEKDRYTGKMGVEQSWRFYFNCSWEEYDSKMSIGLTIFHSVKNADIIRPINEYAMISPTNREEDLKKVEAILHLADKEIQMIENHIREEARNSIIKIG